MKKRILEDLQDLPWLDIARDILAGFMFVLFIFAVMVLCYGFGG